MILTDSNISRMRTTTLSKTSPFLLANDDVPIDQAVGGMGMVATHIDVDAGGARRGTEGAVRQRLLAA